MNFWEVSALDDKPEIESDCLLGANLCTINSSVFGHAAQNAERQEAWQSAFHVIVLFKLAKNYEYFSVKTLSFLQCYFEGGGG